MANKIRTEVRKELLAHFKYNKYSERYIYYVQNIDDNLIGGPMDEKHLKMFSEGNGSELVDKKIPAKAKAIDSSSMICYNFLRIINNENYVEIQDVKYNDVLFEVKLPTLKTFKQAPANIDAALISEDKQKILFIESKFLEFLDNNKMNLSTSYSQEKNYYPNLKEINSIIKTVDFLHKDEIFKSGYNYGIKQAFCHLLGIHNIASNESAKQVFQKMHFGKPEQIIASAKEYKLLNLVYKPKNQDASIFCDKYINKLEYLKKNLSSPLNQYIGNNFVISFRDLFDKLPNTYKDKESLRKRYIDCHY